VLPVLETLDHAPGRLERFTAFYEPLVADARTPARLKRLIEERVEQLDALEREGRLPPDAAGLPLPDGLDAGERALLRFVDQYAADWRAVPDAIYEQLRANYEPDQLMELFWFTAMARSLRRVAAVLHHPG
jgi:alkylhydroperoxidase family enzyme